MGEEDRKIKQQKALEWPCSTVRSHLEYLTWVLEGATGGQRRGDDANSRLRNTEGRVRATGRALHPSHLSHSRDTELGTSPSMSYNRMNIWGEYQIRWAKQTH